MSSTAIDSIREDHHVNHSTLPGMRPPTRRRSFLAALRRVVLLHGLPGGEQSPAHGFEPGPGRSDEIGRSESCVANRANTHADETAMKVCLELSRRCRRRFLSMMNREAFDEVLGIAGWWLRRLGCFSVERGGHSEVAKRFAIDVVKQVREVLVVFHEGESYYLNDLVQPFKSGAIEIGMQALVEMRQGSARSTGRSGLANWPIATSF